MALLEVSNLGIAFGGLQAVSQLDLKIEKGHLYGLIGPNGAGKTTVFNMLTGVYKPTEGNIVLDGNDITGATPEAISKAGIARTFQNQPTALRQTAQAGNCPRLGYQPETAAAGRARSRYEPQRNRRTDEHHPQRA